MEGHSLMRLKKEESKRTVGWKDLCKIRFGSVEDSLDKEFKRKTVRVNPHRIYKAANTYR